MSSIKVLLKTHKETKSGLYPIVLRVIKDRKIRFIFTGHSCSRELWDFENNRPSSKHPNRQQIKSMISTKIAEAESAILNLEQDEKQFSADSIKNKVVSGKKNITVFKFIDEIVDNLSKQNKINNAKIYKDTRRMLFNFRNGADMNFSDLDVPFLNRFERSFSQRGVAGNSISVYMRTIRSVFNKAISEGYCKKIVYPFSEYKISKLETETTKRSLSKSKMNDIIALNVDGNSKLDFAKDIFLFSYYCRGINFKDIALLKWSNVKTDNRLSYKRAKTGLNYNLGMILPAQEILKKYEEGIKSNPDKYIFPILNPEVHQTPSQLDNRIKKMGKIVNKSLKEIAILANVDFNLTTYVARHSFATVLKKSGIPTAQISESLGHKSEKTTQIYLDSFENELLDEANKALL